MPPIRSAPRAPNRNLASRRGGLFPGSAGAGGWSGFIVVPPRGRPRAAGAPVLRAVASGSVVVRRRRRLLAGVLRAVAIGVLLPELGVTGEALRLRPVVLAPVALLPGLLLQ